ncbi:cyclophilin type peptidyl-prolyl cis-trans isomerase [Nitzschia inconspicua]|uniref:Cyclophilin type peptidyl-prolyl cis-trans isomerase n=1 Tax=Nitzschia inconspicua TaxID=303405 RepID=A0A9K3LYJ2_9STRA|nr:cyclophilin type peptidyl-prolyl cis-trans isomerase [Nitzschia inconspicua]
MSRRRANSEDQVSRTRPPRRGRNGNPLDARSVVMPISEDDVSDECDYEYQVGDGGLKFMPDDCSSSNSSTSRLSPSILKTTIHSSLDGYSYNGNGNSSQREHHMPFYPAGYNKKAQHEELIHHERSSSLPSEHKVSIASGEATIAEFPSLSFHRKSSVATRYCNTLVFTARRRKNPFLFAFIMSFTLLGLFLYTKSYATLYKALDQVSVLSQQQNRVREYFLNVEQDIQQLQRELLELDHGAVLLGSVAKGNNENDPTAKTNERGVHGDEDESILEQQKESIVDEMLTLQEKLRQGTSHVGSLQKHLQEISRRDAIQKYGSGVIRVGIELEFQDLGKSKSSIGAPNTLVFEMAPLDLMPHSVYMFLEMVDAGLFDGCSFILNAMHVIKAAPLPYDGSSASQKVKAFTKLGLESVAFREYSPDFPHEQYTVGFAADGSPSFFINTDDNSGEHIGDPCFAKVVSGFDTIHRMQNAPTRNGIFFRKRIGIKSATILK